MSPFSEFDNNNLLYLLWHSNLGANKCTQSLFSQSVVGQIHSRVVRLGKHAHSKQRKTTPTQTAVIRQVYVDALLVQHLYNVFFQHMVWYGPTSETAWMQRRQKN